jgi:L-fucose isomerase-like protein
MWPFIPKYKSKDPIKRMEGLEELDPGNSTQKEILNEIVKYDISFEVRQLAYKILNSENSQEALFDIAKNAKENVKREEAVKKITDQNYLIDIAKNEKDINVRIYGVFQLTDQKVLADFARNDYDGNVRLNALI